MTENERVKQGNFQGSGFNVELKNSVCSELPCAANSESLLVRNPAPNASAPMVSQSPTVHFVLSC